MSRRFKQTHCHDTIPADELKGHIIDAVILGRRVLAKNTGSTADLIEIWIGGRRAFEIYGTYIKEGHTHNAGEIMELIDACTIARYPHNYYWRNIT